MDENPDFKEVVNENYPGEWCITIMDSMVVIEGVTSGDTIADLVRDLCSIKTAKIKEIQPICKPDGIHLKVERLG